MASLRNNSLPYNISNGPNVEEKKREIIQSLIRQGKLKTAFPGEISPMPGINPGHFLLEDFTVTHNTTAVAIFAAALMMCVPKVEIMIFSVSLNSSRKMLQMILDFLDGHPVATKMIKRPTNKDKIIVIGGAGDRRTCESRPGRGNVSIILFFSHVCCERIGLDWMIYSR